MLELRDCHRYNTGCPDSKPVSVGDVVVVHDERPRCPWRLAKVIGTILGRDGQIREALLKVASSTRPFTLRRPLQLLYPLEVSDPPEHSEDLQTEAQQEILNIPSIVPTENSMQRQTRASAVKGRERRIVLT